MFRQTFLYIFIILLTGLPSCETEDVILTRKNMQFVGQFKKGFSYELLGFGPLLRELTFSRDDFTFDKARNLYTCPAGKTLTTTGRLINDGETLLYRASMRDCRSCPLKAQCCPKAPFRRLQRSIYEEARDVARALAKTEVFERSRHDRKRIEMLFAHLKRILRLGRLRLRGPCGAQFEFTLAAIAQNLRRLAKLSMR